jgi:hypothetical protein
MKERRVLCFQAPSFLMRPYKAKPVRVFGFEEIREAHQLMESSQAGSKMMVRL